MSSDPARQAVCSEVARILKEERVKRKLPLTVLAAQCGLSHQMVSYVEREMRNPTLDTLLRITGALGLDLSDIIRRAIQNKINSSLTSGSSKDSRRCSARRER